MTKNNVEDVVSMWNAKGIKAKLDEKITENTTIYKVVNIRFNG